MIVRLVKMTFYAKHRDDFERLFNERRHLIGTFPGCHSVDLLREIYSGGETIVYFTRSIWDSEVDLENYRQSELFQDTWEKTRSLFASKAEAWSTELAATYPD